MTTAGVRYEGEITDSSVDDHMGMAMGGALSKGMGGPLKPPEPEHPMQTGKKTVTQRWMPDDPNKPEGPGGFKKTEIRDEEPEYGYVGAPP